MQPKEVKHLSTARPILLVAAILFFFLPMFNIRCSSPMGGSMNIASVSGQALVTGGKIKANDDFQKQMEGMGNGLFKNKKKDKSIFDEEESNSSIDNTSPKTEEKKADKSSDDKKINPNIIAIVSLLCIIGALIFCFVKISNANHFVMYGAAAAVIALIVLAFTIKSFILSGEPKAGSDLDLGIIKVSPAIGFYLSLLACAAAAVVSYLFMQKEKQLAYHHSITNPLETQPLGVDKSTDTNDINYVSE